MPDKNTYYKYLDNLRKTGVVNMFGASPFLMDEFGLDENTAKTILIDWMNQFNGGE